MDLIRIKPVCIMVIYNVDSTNVKLGKLLNKRVKPNILSHFLRVSVNDTNLNRKIPCDNIYKFKVQKISKKQKQMIMLSIDEALKGTNHKYEIDYKSYGFVVSLEFDANIIKICRWKNMFSRLIKNPLNMRANYRSYYW